MYRAETGHILFAFASSCLELIPNNYELLYLGAARCESLMRSDVCS